MHVCRKHSEQIKESKRAAAKIETDGWQASFVRVGNNKDRERRRARALRSRTRVTRARACAL